MHGNDVIENHDEVEMMSDDDDGGDNNYLDNVEHLDDQGSDEMPRSGHRRGYHSKRGPCTIDDHEDDVMRMIRMPTNVGHRRRPLEWIKKTRKYDNEYY